MAGTAFTPVVGKETIYEKAKDLHVATRVIYPDADGYACSDSARTKKIGMAALKELFLKGVLIDDGDDSAYMPISFTKTSTCGWLTYAVPDGTTATTAVLTLLYSSEYTAE